MRVRVSQTVGKKEKAGHLRSISVDWRIANRGASILQHEPGRDNVGASEGQGVGFNDSPSAATFTRRTAMKFN